MKIPSLLSPTSRLAPLLALAALLPSLSRADVAIVIEEFTDRIVVRYSGTLNTTSYTGNPSTFGGELDPLNSQIYFADSAGAPMGSIRTVIGDPVTAVAPAFGTIGNITGGVFAGDYFVITNTTLAYPVAYVSGAPFSGSLTFAGATMESLGINRALAPGYAWGLSNGEQVTLEVLTGVKKVEILLQQTAAKKAALLTAIRKLNKDLSKAIASGKKAKVAKLKKSVRNLANQIARL